jgi:hypothetical protein
MAGRYARKSTLGFGPQAALVLLEGQQVVAALPGNPLRNFRLAPQRVEAHQGSTGQVQQAEYLGQGAQLVALAGPGHLGQAQPFGAGQGRDQV